MIKIVQGEDVDIIVKFELENGDAFDLTSVDAAEFYFRKNDKTILTRALTDGVTVEGNPINGKMRVPLDDTMTASLLAGEKMDFECMLSEGSKDRIIQFPRSLTVSKRLLTT